VLGVFGDRWSRRRFGALVVFPLWLLMLSGCAALPDFLPPSLHAAIDEPSGVTIAAIPPASPAVRPVVVVARPPALAKLHDLTAAQLVAMIGEPDFRRVEPPAELWQYRSADCVLDLFLYGDGQTFHVVHADARDRDITRADHARCVDGADVLRGRLRGNS
jgi:hypothetical protein